VRPRILARYVASDRVKLRRTQSRSPSFVTLLRIVLASSLGPSFRVLLVATRLVGPAFHIAPKERAAKLSLRFVRLCREAKLAARCSLSLAQRRWPSLRSYYASLRSHHRTRRPVCLSPSATARRQAGEDSIARSEAAFGRDTTRRLAHL